MSAQRYHCEIAEPPKGKRDWNDRILRGGRVQWWGTWRTKRAAVSAWLHLTSFMEPGSFDPYPHFTTTQRARPVKRARKRRKATK